MLVGSRLIEGVEHELAIVTIEYLDVELTFNPRVRRPHTSVLPGFARATAFSNQLTASCPHFFCRGALSDFFQARATAFEFNRRATVFQGAPQHFADAGQPEGLPANSPPQAKILKKKPLLFHFLIQTLILI
jgi:hypothetical protein